MRFIPKVLNFTLVCVIYTPLQINDFALACVFYAIQFTLLSFILFLYILLILCSMGG